MLRAPPGAQPSRLHSATRTPTPGFANPGSVDTQSRSNSAHHRRATIQLTRHLASAVHANRQPRSRPRGRDSERLARAPSRRHPAPPCPSRPDPPKGRRTLDLEDALASNRQPLPPLARWGGEHIPRGTCSCPPFPGRPRCGLACARPHHPVGPTLAGIEPVVGPPVARGAGSLGFSSLFDSARWCERPAAFGAYAFRTEVLRALRRGRDAPVAGNAWSPFTTAFAVARHGFRRSGRRPSLSRARRAFARQGVRRVASFR